VFTVVPEQHEVLQALHLYLLPGFIWVIKFRRMR